MNEKQLNKFFEDLTFNSSIKFYEESALKNEIKELAKKRGITFPNNDLSFFSCVYAYTDRANKNKCVLPKEDVKKSLHTLVGKAVDIDHFRKTIVGHWLEAKLEGDKIIAWGVFYKSSLGEEYVELKKLMEEGVVGVSFEAWGNKELNPDGTYNLTNIEWAGGAILFKEEPAFDGAQMMEVAKKERILEMAKVMTAPKSFVRSKDAISDDYELMKTSKEKNHYHYFQINDYGNGETKEAFYDPIIDVLKNKPPKHTHTIENLEIREVDNHLHTLKKDKLRKKLEIKGSIMLEDNDIGKLIISIEKEIESRK